MGEKTMTTDYDVITVGGGLGGCGIGKALAEKGLRVLVTEREESFKDRIRGEWLAPWGGAEAKMLGLWDVLEKSGHQSPYFSFAGPMRDLRSTTPQEMPALTFFHSAMQEVVLGAARTAGADVLRGENVSHIRTGTVPSVSLVSKGVARDLTARIVICADGRSSMGRAWGGFEVHRGKQRMMGAGLMFEGMSMPEDTSSL